MDNTTHSQPDTKPDPQSLPEPDPNPKPPSPPQSASKPEPSPAQSPPLITTQNSQNPSKIPIRPQKARKLSAATSAPISPSTAPTPPEQSQTLTTTTTTNKPSATKPRRRSAASHPIPQIIKPMSAPGEIDAALRHLRATDPLLASLLDTFPPPHFENHHPPFLALAKSILYQQLALKAGTSIYTRFVALCGGEDSVRPDQVLSLSAQQLKQVGISGRKATYLYDLANKYKSGILSDETVVKMDDRSLSTMLSMVKGIGSWSVHMFMIFSLHRPDVLPVSDLGVRKGVQLLYGLEDLPRPSQMEQLCEKWRPYRSVGAWYMWRFVEGKGAVNVGGLEGGSMVQPLQQIEGRVEDDGQGGQQGQLQLIEPVNGLGNLGACIWGQ